ncbi:GntR family transcriptional regulator [Roseibium sp. SCP14]|uniref:GntR family transcriptional regulator n=1 Tax=Roseibium sp. SCP14 TaxID=3141375 RepID=UPI0033373E93
MKAAKNIGLPKAEQLAQTIEREIREGRFGHGDQLESEGALMRRFSVSRNTVRRGLEKLSRQGLITTRTGIGSFVTYDGTTIDSNLGWTIALSEGEGAIETRLLSLERAPSSEANAALNVETDYLCLDRLRFCQKANCGISLERSRLPWRPEFETVLLEGLHGDSLSETLSEFGLVAASGEEMAGVVPALSGADAAIMKRPVGDPMLRLQRITRCADGSALEYVESLLDPARFGLRISF